MKEEKEIKIRNKNEKNDLGRRIMQKKKIE